MRSESCTFIWQPKVLMQAVLAPRLARPAGLLESGIGAVAVVCVALLIFFLRLVNSGCEGDLPRTALEPQLFDLHVPGPRRPPEYIRNARTFLLPKPAPLRKDPRQAAPHPAISSARPSPIRQAQACKPPPTDRRCLSDSVLCGDVRGWRGCGPVVRSRSEAWGFGRWLLR